MGYFPVDGIEFEDFCLLESFQIGYLPGWVPEVSFAVCLHARPHVARLLRRKHPPIAEFLDRILAENPPADDPDEIERAEAELVETCADILIYNVDPEVYDDLDCAKFDYPAILADRVDVDDAVLIDAAAGTGAVAFSLCSLARTVYAVEPVTRLRAFIREKAAKLGVSNVHAIDGFLHAIPLPDGFADVLVASQALGWSPEEEVPELSRVVRPGGTIAILNDAEKRPMLQPAGYGEASVDGHEHLLLYTKVVTR